MKMLNGAVWYIFALLCRYATFQHGRGGPPGRLARTELPLECSEKLWNMLSVQHCMPLAFSSHSIYVSIYLAKTNDHGENVVAFCAGERLDWGAKEHTYGVPKNVLLGCCDIISAHLGRNDTSGMTKEPY